MLSIILKISLVLLYKVNFLIFSRKEQILYVSDNITGNQYLLSVLLSLEKK